MKKSIYVIGILILIAVIFTLAGSGETQFDNPPERPVTHKQKQAANSTDRSPALAGAKDVDLRKELSSSPPASNHAQIKELLELTRSNELATATQARQQKILAEIRTSPDFYRDLLAEYDEASASKNRGIDAAGLLELMSESSGHQKEVSAIAEAAMVNADSEEVPLPKEAADEDELNRSLSTTEAMILPIVAHEVFLKTTADENVRFDGTLRALKSHKNHNVRSAIFYAFATNLPQKADEMKSEINRLKIPMPE